MNMQLAATSIHGTRHEPITVDRPRAVSSARRRAGTVLVGFLSVVLVASAAAKLIPIPEVGSQMAELGFAGSRLTFIAVLEISSAVLFAFPRSRWIGLLMVSAYLGGAIATHIGHGQFLKLQPEIVLALIWLATWLRHPQVFHRAN
jgi:hypothetical protein